MTYTFKLARRIARLRTIPALLLPLLAACAAGEPTGVSSDENPPIEAGVSQEGPVVISPRSVTVEGTQSITFRAFESLTPGSNQITGIEWTATGGTIAPDGRYTPATTGSFKVLGRRKGNPHNAPDTATVVVVPPQPTLVDVEITPSAATVGAGLQQQFSVVGRQSDSSTVPIGAIWAATGGTIDEGGLYTAGRAAGTYSVIATHVTTGLADTAVVTVPAAVLTSITMTPATVSLAVGQGQQFGVVGRLSDGTSSSVPVTYSATGGSISATGYYTADSTAGTFRVIATADGGLADTSAVTITVPPPSPTLSSIVMTPASVSLGAGQTQQFSVSGKMSDGTTASVSPTYTATGGSVSSTGLYTAGATAGAFRVIATAQGKADTSGVTITVPATLSSIVITPASVSLTTGQGQQFSVSGKMSDGTTASVSPTYTATGGSVSSTGLYTAGATAGTFRVIATAQGKADTSAITIASSSPPPSGSVLWNASFENGAWPTGTGLIQCVAGRIKPFTAATKPYASAPNPRFGLQAVKFETRDTDLHCGGTSESRSQAESPRLMVQGGEYWLAESVYFPTDFPSIDRYFFMFTELYSPVGGGQPAVGLYLQNGSTPKISFNAAYNAATMSNKSVALLDRPKGQWIDLLIHIKISTNPSVGFIELWRDGVNVPLAGGVTTNGVSRLTCQTMLSGHASGGMAMMVNDYRSAANTTSTGVTTLYFDEVKVGTSRAAVDPRAASTSQLLAMQ